VIRTALYRRSLRAKLFEVMATCPAVPLSTTELALLVAFDKPNRYVRVLQVLNRQERKGRVYRFDPVEPAEATRGRRAYRWALTPVGLRIALQGAR
jgi:hypothetical protein